MKRAKLLVIAGVVLLLALLLVMTVSAQGPEEEPPREGGPYRPEFELTVEAEPTLPPELPPPTPPPPPQPERGQRPLPPTASELSAMGAVEMLGVGPLGVGGGPFEVSYFFDGMEAGPGSWTATGLWHIAGAGSSYPNAYNGTASWWYGQEATGNYDTGAANSGYIQTGPISIPAGSEPVWLRFWSWEHTEGSATYDTRKVYTSTNGSDWSVAWQSNPSNDMAQWYEALVDLSGLRGSDVYLRFEFDTVDGSANGYRGWYVDDVAVGYKLIQLFPTGQTGYGVPDDPWSDPVNYPWNPPGQMWVQNNTGVTTAFTITASGAWTPAFPSTTPDLNPGQVWGFGGQVDIPSSAGLGTYDDAVLTFQSQVSPTLTNSMTVRTWAGWVHHVSHQVIDDGSGNSQGDGDGKIDPGERIEMVLTLKNDLDATAFQVNASLTDVGWLLWWNDWWEPYGDIAPGATANSLGRYEFDVPSNIQPGTVITFDLNTWARNGWWFETFTETVPHAVLLEPPAQSGGGDPGDTVTYTLTVENYTGATDSFDLSLTGNSWTTNASPDPTGNIADGASKQVAVTVQIPGTATEGDRDTVTVQAMGVTNPSFTDSAVITTCVLCPYRHVWSGSQSGWWSGSYWYQYGWPPELFATIYISATINAPGFLQVQGWNPSTGTWDTLYAANFSGTQQVQLAYCPAVYDQILVDIDDGYTLAGFAYDYRFETCYQPVQITPQPAGGAAPPGNTVTGILWVQNNTGVDTPFDLTLSGATWSSVVTPTRTITVADGSSEPFTVTVGIPGTASAGDSDGITLMATSVNSPSLSGSGLFTTTAVSSGWYQAYDEDYPTMPWSDPEAYLDSVNSFQEWRLTDDRDGQWSVAVSAFYRDRVPYAWTRDRQNSYGIWVNEVEFGARDVTGTVVIPATRVVDHSQATDEVYDYDPTIAVDPVGGNIALAWTHQDRASPTAPMRWNAYYAVYDQDGNVVRPPTALTSNTDDTVWDYELAIEAYRDGHLAVAWTHWVMTGGIGSIYYAVLNSDGSLVKSPTELTPNTGDWDDFDPRLAQLLDGNMMVVWSGEISNTGVSEAVYAILDTGGNVVQGEIALTKYAAATTTDPDADELDAVDLDTADVVIAWTNDDTRQIEYAILGAGYAVVVPPTVLSNTLSNTNWDVSLTEDKDGRAVFTWRGLDTPWYIYYALVDRSGNVVVEPSIYRSPRNTWIGVHRKGYGNGGMEARPSGGKIYLPIILKNY